MFLIYLDKFIIVILFLISAKYLYVKFLHKKCINNCTKKADNFKVKLGFKAKKHLRN